MLEVVLVEEKTTKEKKTLSGRLTITKVDIELEGAPDPNDIYRMLHGFPSQNEIEANMAKWD